MFNKKNLSSRLMLADKMSVSSRLTLAFGMMIFMLIVGSGIGLSSLSGLNQKIESWRPDGRPRSCRMRGVCATC
jgi:hypothetical protein